MNEGIRQKTWKTQKKKIEEKIRILNAETFYQTTKTFNLQNVDKKSLSYMQRCFTMVVETSCFSELELNSVLRILGSSNLYIVSEAEVYNAANSWLSHNIEESNKYSKQLLLKVGLFFLTDNSIRYF